jgi:hypothetical protein
MELEKIQLQEQGHSSLYKSNNREDNYNKISEREIIGQTIMNPFMLNNTYVNDVVNQENYLKPQSTTIEK